MQMLEVFLTCLPVHSSQPVRLSHGPLIDCFVPSRYGVTAMLGEMAQNASPVVQWGLSLPKDLQSLSAAELSLLLASLLFGRAKMGHFCRAKEEDTGFAL